MQLCGSCAQQVVQTVPILLNPATWLIVLFGLTAVASKVTKKK